MLKVDGKEVARTTVKRTVPAAFSASETFDVGVDLGSTVSLDYFDRKPFPFDGKISAVNVQRSDARSPFRWSRAALKIIDQHAAAQALGPAMHSLENSR